MENSKQDFDIANSESNTETEFSRQVEECQSNLHRFEKLFLNLQKDSQKIIRKSQESLAKLPNSMRKKLSRSCLDVQTPLQEINSKDHFLSNNNIELKKDTLLTCEKNVIKNNSTTPLTFVVQVPSSIVDGFKQNLPNTDADFLNFLSECSSKQSMKSQKTKRISSLFPNIFKRKKNNSSNFGDLLSKNMQLIRFIKSSDGLNENITKIYQRSSEISDLDHASVIEKNFSTETATSDPSLNSLDSQTLIFPINLNSNVHGLAKPNLIIQHEITPKCKHTIKITNDSSSNCNKQSSSKLSAEKVDSEEKEFEKFDLEKLKHENHLMKRFIESLLRSTKNLNNLEILKIFVEILHDEKLKKKNTCMDCSNTKIRHEYKPNFFHDFLQQLMVDLKSRINHAEKNVQQAPIKRQSSSEINVCSPTAHISSEDEYFENPVTRLKPKRMHRNVRRCKSPSLLKYRFCQSEKDIKTEIRNW